MKVYLDIDGTLIHEELNEQLGKPAAGLEKFLEALRPHDVYWLTTHCATGDPTEAQRIMKGVLSHEYHHDIDRIKPTLWKRMKTEGIDMRSDFLWLDNDIFIEEWQALVHRSPTQKVIEIDLIANPHQLEEVTRELL